MEVQYKGRWGGGGDGRSSVGRRGGWMHERRGEERGEVREGEGKDGQEVVCGSCARAYMTLPL